MSDKKNPLVEPLGPLFTVLPLEQAMPNLRIPTLPMETLRAPLEGLKSFYPTLGLQTGLWVYGDFFEEAHTIAQGLETSIGSYWHGILHRREGDFWNAKYWLKRARTIELDLPIDSIELVDRVERSESDEPLLVEAQRTEWRALFTYCLNASHQQLRDVEN